MPKEGTRVGAILSAGGGTVHLLGYGTYEGDKPLFDKPGALLNPKITLDNGKVVWGCECWWGPEDNIKAKVSSFKTVVEVDIDAARLESGREVTVVE